jgi:hypothetical protein
VCIRCMCVYAYVCARVRDHTRSLRNEVDVLECVCVCVRSYSSIAAIRDITSI